MNHITSFFETQSALDALNSLLHMAYEQDDYEGMVEISQGLEYCESAVEFFQACWDKK